MEVVMYSTIPTGLGLLLVLGGLQQFLGACWGDVAWKTV